jgi:hypothetical protein
VPCIPSAPYLCTVWDLFILLLAFYQCKIALWRSNTRLQLGLKFLYKAHMENRSYMSAKGRESICIYLTFFFSPIRCSTSVWCLLSRSPSTLSMRQQWCAYFIMYWVVIITNLMEWYSREFWFCFHFNLCVLLLIPLLFLISIWSCAYGMMNVLRWQ